MHKANACPHFPVIIVIDVIDVCHGFVPELDMFI